MYMINCVKHLGTAGQVVCSSVSIMRETSIFWSINQSKKVNSAKCENKMKEIKATWQTMEVAHHRYTPLQSDTTASAKNATRVKLIMFNLCWAGCWFSSQGIFWGCSLWCCVRLLTVPSFRVCFRLIADSLFVYHTAVDVGRRRQDILTITNVGLCYGKGNLNTIGHCSWEWQCLSCA